MNNVSVRSDRVNFQYDGLGLTPLESSDFLHRILEAGEFQRDTYSLGGVVEELEKEMSSVLGKERAIFMPSGTLANHLALRNLSKPGQRIVVQDMSHIYNDSGDCVQSLSGRTLLPVDAGKENDGYKLTVEQIKRIISTTDSGKVKTGIGVISIESPIRRMNGIMLDSEDMQSILDFAITNGIRTHLDGARLFIAAAYSGVTAADYARRFDTVYVSLYKYFNAPFGAILAGSTDLIEDLYHQRRMFGAGLNEVWPSAVLALHSMKDFSSRYKIVMQLSENLLNGLNDLNGLKAEKIINGTNVFRLILDEELNPLLFRNNLLKSDIVFPVQDDEFNGFYFKTNESILNDDFESIFRKIESALVNS